MKCFERRRPCGGPAAPRERHALPWTGHKGTGFLYWAVAELRCYPQSYKAFMDSHLKYYLFPDLWGLLVLTGLNAAFIPMMVPFASEVARFECAKVNGANARSPKRAFQDHIS